MWNFFLYWSKIFISKSLEDYKLTVKLISNLRNTKNGKKWACFEAQTRKCRVM